MTPLIEDRSVKRTNVPVLFIKHGMAYANTRDIADFLDCPHGNLISKIDQYKREDQGSTIDWWGFDCLETIIARQSKRGLRKKQYDIGVNVMRLLAKDQDFLNEAISREEHNRRIQLYIETYDAKIGELAKSKEIAGALNDAGRLNATGQWLFDRGTG